MNFRSDYFIFIILSITLKITSIEGNGITFEACTNLPKDLEVVLATVYFNGCTDPDRALFTQICDLKDGFSSDVLSLTLKVGADMCITEFGMDQQLESCMNGETSTDPKKIALDNAIEVLNKGVDLENAGEPFTLFTENYDYCIDIEAYWWWGKSVCAQLTQEKSAQLINCQ